MYPTPQQLTKIEKTFDGVRFIFNKMLTDKLAYYNETGKQLKNTPAQYKTAFPWLREVDSLALANAQMNLQAAFENFFRNVGNGFPKFKSKKHSKNRYTTNLVNGNILIKDSMIKLPKLGFVKMRQHRAIPDGYTLKSVTVKCDFKGRYYACVLFEYEPQKTDVLPQSCIGVEYSDKGLFTDSNGREIGYPPYIRKTIKKLRREKKRLANMKYKSQNRDKQHKKVLKIREKFYRQRDDFLHKQSRQIANAYDIVCVKEPVGGVESGFGWTMFKFFLKYKLADQGKSFIRTEGILLNKMLYSRQAV